MFVDCHCHIYKEYYDNIGKIVEKSVRRGICILINNACNLSTSKEVVEYSYNYNNMYCVLGLHPSENLDELKEVLSFIKFNLNNNKMIGIGEIGLDYYYTKDNRSGQIFVFEEQLKFAEEYNLPVIIHSRNATDDTINILKKYKVKGIIHCFNGSFEVAKEYIKMGFKLGINGVVTFKNCKLIDVIKKIGIENIVFETDSPYLTPVPYRGEKNDPSYIIDIVDFVSENLGIDKGLLEEVSNRNICTVFDININS